MDRIVLDVDGLGVAYDGDPVLKDISFRVTRGQSVVLVGPNGSGKSTLLRTLLGFVPHSGTVRWASDARIGYVPQTIAVDPDLPLTTAEFFACKGIGAARAADLLERVGMGWEHREAARARRYILAQPLRTLSGGQLQRTLIAWALAGDPSVLLFDEPTSGIDIGGQETVYSLLTHLKEQRGLTLIMASHDLDIVFAHADHVLCVNRTLVCHGPPRQALDAAMIERLYGHAAAITAHRDTHAH